MTSELTVQSMANMSHRSWLQLMCARKGERVTHSKTFIQVLQSSFQLVDCTKSTEQCVEKGQAQTDGQ
jgi:hypothetical protein